ncbi:hypothetical protein NLJ89_g2891 [Agrocybe chaxingu]|uniref:Lanthionine synthetase C family protein n=1 Tax=Agrocybe chaxingu TaxID=84603 RepID=A0A9W8KAL4_9AGAR|nr:hypothetical protein NLJ89_g2891 [Agrocybe chaxingu]
MPPTPRFIPLPSKPPSELKDWESLNTDISNALLKELRKVQQSARDGKVSRHDSIYTGISGIAFMEYHLASMRTPLQNEILAPNLLVAVGDRNLARALRHSPIDHKVMYSPSRLSFIESSVGLATLVLIRASSTTERIVSDSWQEAKRYLEYTIEQTLAEDAEIYSPSDKEDGCEVLYGRAGLLYALLYLRKHLDGRPQQERASLESLTSDVTLSRLVDSIVQRGQHGSLVLSSEFRARDSAYLPPLMWTWHRKRYMGGAHGLTGILQILLSCPSSLVQKHLPVIFRTLSWLVDIQDESGNWPTKCPTQLGVSGDSDLVQMFIAITRWCHGAPGIVMLLSIALRILQIQKDLIAVEEPTLNKLYRSLQLGAQAVYHRGLLRKGVGLCHGVAGNVYALLATSDVIDTSSDRRYFAKAAHLAFLATFHDDKTVLDMTIPDHPWSLFEGLAGMCCAWAEVLSRMDSKLPRRPSSGFPAYDDLVSV